MGEIAPSCILGSNFLVKTALEVDFKLNKLRLHQRDITKIEPLREPCIQEEERSNQKAEDVVLKC